MLGFVDVPGHEKLVHNMLAGATGIDFVLLVVAADDGPMPQTREHLQILDLLGMNRAAVALTKIDAVSAARVTQAEGEIDALLASSALASAPVFRVSNVTGEGMIPLRHHLDAESARASARPAGGHFRLAIDRCFTLAGAGTVVTGTVFSGKVSSRRHAGTCHRRGSKCACAPSTHRIGRRRRAWPGNAAPLTWWARGSTRRRYSVDTGCWLRPCMRRRSGSTLS